MHSRLICGLVVFLLVSLSTSSSALALAPKDPCEAVFEWDPVPYVNPLLVGSWLDHEAIPFHLIEDRDFRAALLHAIEQSKQRVLAIRNSQEKPTFENVIEALEAANEPHSRVKSVFNHFLHARSSPELDALADEISPQEAQLYQSIYFDARIFTRVETIYNQRAKLSLAPEQERLLEATYQGFLKNGAKLSAAQKARVSEIDRQIPLLEHQFQSNLNAPSVDYEIVIRNRMVLAGVPVQVVKAAAKEANRLGLKNAWVINLKHSKADMFLQFAKNRMLRERIWRASTLQGRAPGTDNRPLHIALARLRQERARIFGYPSHADAVASNRMAGSSAAAELLLKELAHAYLPAARRELAELQALAGHELKPWDVSYYAGKLKRSKYSFSEKELQAYFPIDRVLEGAFYAARRLFGVTFRSHKDLPGWHPTVKVYEVSDSQGRHLGLFYFDPYSRSSKTQGAWSITLKEGGWIEGRAKRPHVANILNFPAPAGDAPTLLIPHEVVWIFHEFGHALQDLLSQVKYREFFGRQVPWDFIEFASMLLEKWAFEPEVLAVYARHYETGMPMPQHLLVRFEESRKFLSAWNGLTQVNWGLLDLAWHGARSFSSMRPEDVLDWEEKVLAPYRLLPSEGALMSPWFSHVFASGYAGGYYSYKWAELLVADTFEAFKKAGIFDPELARRLRTELLEIGGSDDPEVRYLRFRGREPDPAALLRSEGLLGP